MNAPATLRELIDARAVQYGDRPFLIALDEAGADAMAAAGPGETLSFAALRDDCRRLEAAFGAAGLRPGDTISVYMSNGIQTARLLLAAMYSGLVANPVNLLCQPSQTRYIVEHSDTRLIFAERATAPAIRGCLDEARTEGFARPVSLAITEPDARALPTLELLDSFEPAELLEAVEAAGSPDRSTSAVPRARAAARRAPAPAGLAASVLPEPDGGIAAVPAARFAADASATPTTPAAGDVALLMYTSGTTGLPKGVLLSHRSLLANARNISAEHCLSADDRVFGSLPLYHINGLVVTLLAPLFHGGSVVLAPRFSARTFWRDVSRHGCTWINVVPTIVAYLLNAGEPCGFDLSRLKFCRSASAALPADHHRAFEARFGVGIIETMGMTETAAPVFSNPYDKDRRRVGSIGLPSGAEARVVDAAGNECAPGECGELVLRGEPLMHGYYKRPEDTAAAFTADGWLRTGDLGYRDADGYFYINGRAKELIIKGGENIAPREIDEALLRHPDVLDAAAVGVPDDAYGQEIVAFVVPRPTPDGGGRVDVAGLREHCLRELGRYKTPREFRLVGELPRGPSGKVQRLKLLQS